MTHDNIDGDVEIDDGLPSHHPTVLAVQACLRNGAGCYAGIMRMFRSLTNDEEYAQTQADFVAAIDGVATETSDQVVGVPAWPHWVTRVRMR